MSVLLSQGTDESVVAEDENPHWDDEAQRYGHDVVGHLQPAVDDQTAVIEHEVARRRLELTYTSMRKIVKPKRGVARSLCNMHPSPLLANRDSGQAFPAGCVSMSVCNVGEL